MDENIQSFRSQMARYRANSGLSYRGLGAATGIKYSALAAIQTGTRPCGEQTARRLAVAFGLAGDAREAFVLSALNTSKEKVLAAVSSFPAEVLNLLGLLLMARGIKPAHITRCDFDPRRPANLALFLDRRRTVHLHVEVSGSSGKCLHHQR